MYSYKRKMDSTSSAVSKAIDPFAGVQHRSNYSLAQSTTSSAQITQLVVLAAIWYACAIVTITSSKEIMIRVQLPYFLCFSQFLIASVASYGYLFINNKLKPIPSEARGRVIQVTATYTLGFVLTNIAFSLATPASVETVKAAEPLSTVLIGLLFMNEVYSGSTYLSLLPICAGVALACYNNDSFHLQGFILAMASNFCFSARAVYTKMLNSAHPNAVDDITLFCAISVRGLVFLLPITLLIEGSTIWDTVLTSYNAASAPAADMTPGAVAAVAGMWVLPLLALLNGCMFAGYNLTSYIVLRRTELVTHSVLNVFRRVFIIVFTSFYFQSQMTVMSMVGIILATLGVLAFSSARKNDKRDPGGEDPRR